MSRELLGAIILYVPVAAASAVVWACVWRLFRIWEGRDVMGQFRPKAKHVHHTTVTALIQRLREAEAEREQRAKESGQLFTRAVTSEAEHLALAEEYRREVREVARLREELAKPRQVRNVEWHHCRWFDTHTPDPLNPHFTPPGQLEAKCGVCGEAVVAFMALLAPTPTTKGHEFTEDINDGSMCVCGIPALTHDQVVPTTDTEGNDQHG